MDIPHDERSQPPHSDAEEHTSLSSSPDLQVRYGATESDNDSRISFQARSEPASPANDTPTVARCDSLPFEREETDNLLNKEVSGWKRKRRGPIYWWWWEIVASALSLMCMGSVFVIVGAINGKPLQAWKLPIEANSLVSVFVTIAQTATMVPVTSSISQLKWHHYHDDSQPLNHLTLYDEASRGPWGAFIFLIELRRPTLAVTGALITILALTVQPSAQQVLSRRSRQTLMQNVTASIGVAHNYSAKSSYYDGGPGSEYNFHTALDAASFESVIRRAGVGGAMPYPEVYCPYPATSCQWEGVSTLGICAETFNMSEYYTPVYRNKTYWYNCGWNMTEPDSRNCEGKIYVEACDLQIRDPGSFGNIWDISVDELQGFNFTIQGNPIPQDGTLGIPYAVNPPLVSFGNPKFFNNWTSIVVTVRFDPDLSPDFEVLHSYWAPCVQTFSNVTANSSGKVEYGKLDYRGPSYIDDVRSIIFNEPNGEVFKIAWATWLGLSYHIATSLFQEADLYTDRMRIFWYLGDISKAVQNAAIAASATVRTQDNRFLSMLPGVAWYEQYYMKVRWGWLTLPVLEVLLRAILLGIVIVRTRKQPLLKTSPIGLLIHGIHGWTDEELTIEEPEAAEKLEYMAEEMTAAMENHGGRLKFVRKDVPKSVQLASMEPDSSVDQEICVAI